MLSVQGIQLFQLEKHLFSLELRWGYTHIICFRNGQNVDSLNVDSSLQKASSNSGIFDVEC